MDNNANVRFLSSELVFVEVFCALKYYTFNLKLPILNGNAAFSQKKVVNGRKMSDSWEFLVLNFSFMW